MRPDHALGPICGAWTRNNPTSAHHRVQSATAFPRAVPWPLGPRIAILLGPAHRFRRNLTNQSPVRRTSRELRAPVWVRSLTARRGNETTIPRFELFRRGRRILTRVEMIDAAEKTLDLQYFHLSRRRNGRLLTDAPDTGGDRGLRVRVLIDDGDTVAGMSRSSPWMPIRTLRFGSSIRSFIAGTALPGAASNSCSTPRGSTTECTTSC